MLMADICCERMDYDLQHKCSDHPNRFGCPDGLISRTRSGFGIIVHDGGLSTVQSLTAPGAARNCRLLRAGADYPAAADPKADVLSFQVGEQIVTILRLFRLGASELCIVSPELGTRMPGSVRT